MITTFYPPYNFGGDGIFVQLLAEALARRGHHVDVIHCKDAYNFLSGNSEDMPYQDHPNVTVYGLKSGVGALSPIMTQMTGAPWFKKKAIEKILAKNNYDVIHYHNMSLIGLKTLVISNAVKIFTSHEHWLICPMHVLWKLDKKYCDKKECFKCSLHGGIPPQLWRYTNHVNKCLAQIDMLISPSVYTRGKLAIEGIKAPMTVLPLFKRQDENLEYEGNGLPRNTSPYFLFAGRLEKIKGLQELIPVFKKFDDLELKVAGEGSYGNHLRIMAEGMENVKFLGKISRPHLFSLYKGATGLILPSLCPEVFGTVVLEAFSMKTPVIVRDRGALPELIDQSGGGILFSDEESLLQAIRSLADNDRLRNDLGNKGYAASNKNWTEEKHIGSYLELVQELKARKGK